MLSPSPLPSSPRFEVIDLRELFRDDETTLRAENGIDSFPYAVTDADTDAIVSRHATIEAAALACSS